MKEIYGSDKCSAVSAPSTVRYRHPLPCGIDALYRAELAARADWEACPVGPHPKAVFKSKKDY